MPQTIALVDDDRNILTSVSIALEAEGFEVRTYTDGDEALRGLRGRAEPRVRVARAQGSLGDGASSPGSGDELDPRDLPDVEGR